MGGVAELTRWECDVCGKKKDGVKERPPDLWGSLMRNDTRMLAYCPKCAMEFLGVQCSKLEDIGV